MIIRSGSERVEPTGSDGFWSIDRRVDQRLLDRIADAMERAGLSALQVFAAEIVGNEGNPIVRFHYRKREVNQVFGYIQWSLTQYQREVPL